MKIVLDKVSKKYEEKYLFKNISMTINQGDFIVIKGHSGSGKTTLGNIIGAMDTPTSGKVRYEPSPKNLYRNDISFIFQNYGLLENETVYQNLKLAFIGREEEYSKYEQVLAQVGLSCELNSKVKILSGGEKQRLAIARVLLKNPNVIIADEPTGNLDDDNTQIINQMLFDLHAVGKTIILISHKQIDYPLKKEINLNKLK